MGFDRIKKNLDEKAAERQHEQTVANQGRKAWDDMFPTKFEAVVKPSFEGLADVFRQRGNDSVSVKPDQEMTYPGNPRQGYSHGQTTKALLTFDWQFLAPGYGVGSAPIHAVVADGTFGLSIIAWDFRREGQRYVVCANIGIHQITRDRLESILDTVADNMFSVRAPNDGL